MTIRQWSTTASGNANAASINWAEGQAPSTVNNSARELMAQIRQEYDPERWGWIAFSATVSVASQTVFKITGNQTDDYVANRKVKLTGGSATVYADILSASYTSETTVTIQNASGSLSSSMSIAWLSAVYGNNLPGNVVTGSGTSTFAGAAAFQSSVSFSASVKFGGFVSFSATVSSGFATIGQALVTPTITDAAFSGTHTGDFALTGEITQNSNPVRTYQTATNEISGTNYTLVLGDAWGVVRMNPNGAPRTITIPPNSSVAFPIGTRITIYHNGTGANTTTVSPGSGVTLNSLSGSGSITASTQRQLIDLIKIDTNEWHGLLH